MCIFMSVNVMAQSVQDEVKKEVAAMDVKLKEVDSTYSLDKKTRMKLTTLMVSQKHKMAKAVKAKTSPAKLEKMEMGFQGEIGKLLGGARMGVLAGTITADDGPGPSSHF